jgi:hypothetical protein
MLRKYAMAAIIAAGALGAGIGMTAQAGAMPMPAVHADGAPLVKIRNGCGRGWHLNRWGRCVPYRRYHSHRHYGWHHREWRRPHHRHWRHHHRHHRHHWRDRSHRGR